MSRLSEIRSQLTNEIPQTDTAYLISLIDKLVPALRQQNDDVIQVLEAESKYNEEEHRRLGVRKGHNLLNGRWEINAAMYALSYSGEVVNKLLEEMV